MQLLNTISSNRFINRHGVKIAWAVALLCALLLLWNIGSTVKAQQQIKHANYSVKPTLTTARDNRPNYRASDITRANLLGNPNPTPVVRRAPKTTLDLTLQGILWASEASMARAIIMSGKRNAKLYAIGESIDGAGASVKEIRDGEVILNRNGALESLPLLKKTVSGNRQVVSYTASASTGSDVARIVPSRSERSVQPQRIQRSSAQPRSRNGKNRKIRKPNFSGLDKALKKMGEI